MPRTLESLRKLLRAQRWADRKGVRREYDTAIAYLDADMHGDAEDLLAERYSATQRDPDPGNRMEAVTYALVQQYIDEMASVYTGTVERRLVDDEGNEDAETTDKVLTEMDRTGYDQVLQAMDRRVVLLRSCGIDYGVETGHVNPVIYPPQDTYPVKPTDKIIDAANQDSYQGYTLDRQLFAQPFGFETSRRYTLLEREESTDYIATAPDEPHEVTGGKAASLHWDGDKLTDDGRLAGKERQPLQPLVMWHAVRPVGQLVPLGSCAIFRANRWLNVLWTVILDVLRFQAGSTLVIDSMAPETLDPYRAVGHRHPIVNNTALQETATYLEPGADPAGLAGGLSTFARTLGLSLRLSGDDLSLERTAESGISRQIANIPKERARAERVKWYTNIETHYAWPRYAACMIWLGRLDEKARKLHLQVSLKPAPLPTNQVERIELEDHDLKIGITTPTKILAERLKIDEDVAREMLRAMREAEAADVEDEPSAAPPVEVGKVQALVEVLEKVGAEVVPIDSALALFQTTFSMSLEQAEMILNPYREALGAEPEPPPEAPPGGGIEPGVPPVEDKDAARKSFLAGLVTGKKEETPGAELE